MIWRYGLSERRISKALTQMSDDSKKYGIGITIPVTGEILTEARAKFLKSFLGERFEITVHGFHHEDFSVQSKERLIEDISRAKDAFERYGFHPTGYRAPYLKSGKELLPLLVESGFSYSSSRTSIVDWTLADNRELLTETDQIASKIYGSKRIDMEEFEKKGSLFDIPVSLPDDEILIDRMGIRDDDLLGSILEDVIRASLRSLSFAVIQIHPERYLLMRKALLTVVDKLLREGGISFVTLRDLSGLLSSGTSSTLFSGDRKYVCVTGDLDIMSLRDLGK
jgi:peptidoglycan/xylan/chitin deacetylase (PgdA/CDA1 family)